MFDDENEIAQQHLNKVSEHFKEKEVDDLFKQFNIVHESTNYEDENYDSDESSGEYCVMEGEIDINDYETADTNPESLEYEFKNDINIINILTLYYKQTFNIQEKLTIFDGIKEEDEAATTKCMEYIYGEIFRYEKSDTKDKHVLYDLDANLDLENYRELYCLMVNDEAQYVSPFVLTIAGHLAKQNWLNMDWRIINII